MVNPYPRTFPSLSPSRPFQVALSLGAIPSKADCNTAKWIPYKSALSPRMVLGALTHGMSTKSGGGFQRVDYSTEDA